MALPAKAVKTSRVKNTAASAESRKQRNAISARGCRKRKGEYNRKRESIIKDMSAEREQALRYISDLEEQVVDLDASLSLYTTGISVLNDPSEEGSIAALRENAFDRLQLEGPRKAKLSMLKDLCEWDIGGSNAEEAICWLAQTPSREVTVQFIESFCVDLIDLVLR